MFKHATQLQCSQKLIWLKKTCIWEMSMLLVVSKTLKNGKLLISSFVDITSKFTSLRNSNTFSWKSMMIQMKTFFSISTKPSNSFLKPKRMEEGYLSTVQLVFLEVRRLSFRIWCKNTKKTLNRYSNMLNQKDQKSIQTKDSESSLNYWMKNCLEKSDFLMFL